MRGRALAAASLMRHMAMRIAGVPLLVTTCIPLAGAGLAIDLTLQTRDREAGRIVAMKERFDPTKIGVVIVDMWNTNDCMTNAQRCAALVPRMNKVLQGARRLGMQIIWAPTDVASQYAATPQRERAIALPH